MKRLIAMISTLVLGHNSVAAPLEGADKTCPAFLNVEMRKLHSSEKVNLCQFYTQGKPLLIVNTASHCGFTKQFKGLEALYAAYKAQGLVVLGFPSNSFKQEEAAEAATASVCYQNYGVTFPMFQTVSVKGEDAHPLFVALAEKTQAPSWNFNKYLIDSKNKTLTHFGSMVSPQGSKLEEAIKEAL